MSHLIDVGTYEDLFRYQNLTWKFQHYESENFFPLVNLLLYQIVILAFHFTNTKSYTHLDVKISIANVFTMCPGQLLCFCKSTL
jgi:hypothetical protein